MSSAEHAGITEGQDAGRRPLDDEIDVYGLTHPGKVRKTNQDHFLICALQKQTKLFHTSLPDASKIGADERVAFISVVADGVGGHAGGEEASRHVLEGITRYISEAIHTYYTADPHDDEDFKRALEESALTVHNELAERSSADRQVKGMATTLTLWLGVWPHAYLLQVGDSRCYTLRDGTLVQMSRDQTMAQDFVDQGIFTRDDPAHARLSHILSSAIGGPEAAPIVRRFDQNWANVGLLCSDGLTRHVPDDRIRERLMTMTSARQVCEDLLQDALDGGGEDNITVVVGRSIAKT
ncbi:MAG: PP2C family protein-serine/threonine phosphatase [Gemmatimonadaceae bacterium]